MSVGGSKCDTWMFRSKKGHLDYTCFAWRSFDENIIFFLCKYICLQAALEFLTGSSVASLNIQMIICVRIPQYCFFFLKNFGKYRFYVWEKTIYFVCVLLERMWFFNRGWFLS
jgi:hypothetical protein